MKKLWINLSIFSLKTLHGKTRFEKRLVDVCGARPYLSIMAVSNFPKPSIKEHAKLQRQKTYVCSFCFRSYVCNARKCVSFQTSNQKPKETFSVPGIQLYSLVVGRISSSFNAASVCDQVASKCNFVPLLAFNEQQKMRRFISLKRRLFVC